MHLADQSEAVVGHSLCEVELPQRAAPVQGRAGDLTDDLIEFTPAAGRGNLHTAQVVVEVDWAVLQPHRMVQSSRNVDELVAQRVEQMQPPAMVRRNTSKVNSPSKSAAWTIATFSVWVCRFGVSLYSSMASMPLSRFMPHPIRGRRLDRSTIGPNIPAL